MWERVVQRGLRPWPGAVAPDGKKAGPVKYNLELTASEIEFLRLSLEYIEEDMSPWDYNEGDEEKLVDMIQKLKRFEQRVVVTH